MNRTSVVDMVKAVLNKEQKRLSKNTVVGQSVRIIDELESRGLIEKVKYRLPLADTIGRTTVSKRTGKAQQND